jgi:nucleotide-binding universal stress UspA family protein
LRAAAREPRGCLLARIVLPLAEEAILNTTFKKILVPVDFSVGSRQALDLAATMARAFNASVEVFHVWQPPPLVNAPLMFVPESGAPPQALEDVARRLATAELKTLVDRLRSAGVSDVQSRVVIGNPAHEILAQAACGFDLVVMGTHGRTGLAHAILGSVAEKVVRRASCPVMTVRSVE